MRMPAVATGANPITNAIPRSWTITCCRFVSMPDPSVTAKRPEASERRARTGDELADRVETEPPRPQEAGPDQAERQAVRRHWFLPEAVALTKEEGRHDGGEAARHVDHETAREVDCARLEDPALR